MENNNQNNQFGRKQTIGLAIIGVLIVVCFILDYRLGIGIVVGVAGAFLLVKFGMEVEKAPEKQEKSATRFIDTAVLQQNFQIPQNLPIPYAVLNIRGNVLVYNKKFAEIFPGDGDSAETIEQLKKTSGAGESAEVQIGEKFYQGALDHCDIVEESGAVGTVLTMTLIEATKQHELESMMARQQSVVALVFLDNFEDVADTVDEGRMPILTALIERKLNQMATEADGMLKKLEKDRYLFVLSKGNLDKLKEKKFDVLNDVKEVSIGDHIPVTLSIGVGIAGVSLEDAGQNAKAAMDLALGRGGDQVVIKEGEKFFFYGGKSAEVERNSRIRARVKADALWELMDGASSVLVMGHKNSDLDSIGSCMGICAIAKGMDKRCHIVLDEVSMGIRRLWNRVEECVQYDGITLKTPEALKMMDEKTLVIVVDTHRSTRVESPQVLEAAKRVVVFDHHRRSADYIDQAVLTYHEPFASSTSELVTEMIQHFGKRVKLNALDADALLAGITVDTKNFAIKTGAITFETAGFLRRNGADGVRVRRFFQNDMDSYRARAMIVKDAELYFDSVAISACPDHVVNATVVSAQAADELINVTGIRVSFVCSRKDNTVNISARSYGDVNVQRIMEKLGGGGHMTVAGAQLEDCSIAEAKEQILAVMKEYFEEEV